MARTSESDVALPMAIGSPKATAGFISENWTIQDLSKKILDLDVYMEQLQFKKNKMGNRENHSTIQFLNNAIEVVKEERMKLISAVGKREGIRCKKWEKDEFKENEKEGNNGNAEEIKKRERRKWMSCVKLWNSDHDQNHNPNTDKLSSVDSIKKRKGEMINCQSMDNLFSLGKSVEASGIAFDYLKGFPNFPKFNKEEGMKKSLLIPPTPEFKNFPNILQADYPKSSRKPRLRWTPMLHIQFVHALTRLGGPQAAMPENILKLMQVDSLTIDEVKSHLQIYRVHMRKLPPVPSSKPSNSQLGSPEGPLHLDGSSSGTSPSIEMEVNEEEETQRSERQSNLSVRNSSAYLIKVWVPILHI